MSAKIILRGDVVLDEIDYVVAHLDALKIVTPLRGILKDRFPTVEYGSVGIDIGVLTRHFKSGLKYTVQKDSKTDEFGVCKCVIAKLDMPDEEIEENVGALVKAVCTHRTARLGPFIDRALLMVPYTTENFRIPFEHWLPKPEAKDKKKKKK